MKTHRIEVRRLVALRDVHGAFEIDAEVLLASGPAAGPTSVVALSLDDARTLQVLLKTRLAEVDKRKGRSQR